MVHVEEPVFADAGPRRDGVLHADSQVLGDLPAQRVQVALARLAGGKIVDTMLA